MNPILEKALVAALSSLLLSFVFWIHRKIWGSSNFDKEKEKYTKKEYIAQHEESINNQKEIVDHCEIGFGGGKDEDGNWVVYLMFPNQQDITILCKDKEEYDFWVKYADM